MHIKSKILSFLILCGFSLSQINNKNNVQDDIDMCILDKGIKLKRTYSSIKIGNDIISWSPCSINSTELLCPKNSLICMKNGVNLGTSFNLVQDENFPNKYVLQSQNGDKCRADQTRKYVVYISFHEYSIEPHLLASDKCEYHIEAPDLTTEIPCTKRTKTGHLLDFRLLSNDFYVQNGEETYIFNLCGKAVGCDDEKVASCVIGSQKNSFGDVSRSIINYEEQNGAVQFQFRNNGHTTRVDLNCNWTTISGKPTFLESVSSEKVKKFALDSSLGCVKLPMDCKIVGEYNYDLSDLYKDVGNWIVSNSRNRKLEINICGPLRNARGTCKDQHSQVCETVGRDTLNYGSIFVDKDVKGDIIKARLIHGSVCPKNDTLTLTTDLTFKCSLEEKGPVLLNSTDCSLDIVWETPKGCPFQVKIKKDLKMNDRLGQRNLSTLCDKGDRTHQTNSTYYITYNLCTPLKKPCNNNVMNVSACLYVNGKENVLGYYKDDKLISKDGLLSMEFSGEPCKTLNISFACDYGMTIQGQVDLEIIHDSCVYYMKIKTPAACVAKANSSPEKHCSAKNGTLFYNLAGLARTSSNYKFTAGNKDIQYVMNICNPVVTEPEAMCRSSNICIYNKTEPNIKYRFFSIGSQISIPRIVGDNLTIEVQYGDMCAKTKGATSGIIYFKCSVKESGPKFLKETDCLYEFLWETPHACPRPLPRPSLQCHIAYENQFLDLDTVENRLFDMPYVDGSRFEFDICSDNYTRIYKDGRNETLRARREAREKQLTFHLMNKCSKDNEDEWHKMSVNFGCRGDDQDIFEIGPIQNCTIFIKYNTKSNKFCKQKDRTIERMVNAIFNEAEKKISSFEKFVKNISANKQEVSPAQTEKHDDRKIERKVNDFIDRVDEKISTLEKVVRNISVNKELTPQDPTEKPVKNKESRAEIFIKPTYNTTCTITYGEEKINLNQLPPLTLIAHSGSRYSIGLANSNYCSNGYICKDNITIATLSDCPKAYIKDSELRVIFNNTESPAGPFISTITFKCNLTMEYPRINGENKNSLELIYPMERICLRQSSNAGIIVGIVILIIIIIAGLFYVTRRYCKRRYFMLRGEDDKSNMYIYARNSQD